MAICIAACAGEAFAQNKKVTIGIVAKSQSNPVFQAAHQGARDAARDWGRKHDVDVTVK